MKSYDRNKRAKERRPGHSYIPDQKQGQRDKKAKVVTDMEKSRFVSGKQKKKRLKPPHIIAKTKYENHAIKQPGGKKTPMGMKVEKLRLCEHSALLDRAGRAKMVSFSKIRRLGNIFNLPLIPPPLVIVALSLMPSLSLAWASSELRI